MSQLDEDDRLLPILHRLVYESAQPTEPTNASNRVIKPEQVDEVCFSVKFTYFSNV